MDFVGSATTHRKHGNEDVKNFSLIVGEKSLFYKPLLVNERTRNLMKVAVNVPSST